MVVSPKNIKLQNFIYKNRCARGDAGCEWAPDSDPKEPVKRGKNKVTKY